MEFFWFNWTLTGKPLKVLKSLSEVNSSLTPWLLISKTYEHFKRFEFSISSDAGVLNSTQSSCEISSPLVFFIVIWTTIGFWLVCILKLHISKSHSWAAFFNRISSLLFEKSKDYLAINIKGKIKKIPFDEVLKISLCTLKD